MGQILLPLPQLVYSFGDEDLVLQVCLAAPSTGIYLQPLPKAR